GYGDGTPAAPTARVPVRIERKKTRRVLVTSARDSQIAQIQQSSVAGLANRHAIDVRQRPEFVGLLQFDAAPACVQGAGGDRGVTLFERRRDRAWNNAISRDAILRVEKLHLLFQQADPCHTGHFGGAPDRPLDALAEVVEFAVRILSSRAVPQGWPHWSAGGDAN